METIRDSFVVQAGDEPRSEATDAELAGDCVRLYFQPFADLQSGQLVGLEAWACLRQPASHGGATDGPPFMSDGEFLNACDINDSLLVAILQNTRDWKNQGLGNIRIAVSISLQQLRHPKFAEKVGAALAAAELEPGTLCLQFIENHLMEDALAVETTLGQLKALGINLVLDHFGAGVTSLSYLRRHPFDSIKIDRSLIQDLDSDPDATATTQAIVAMAHSLGLCVQAAGVATEDQCNFLLKNMCDEIQGMLFSPPLPADQITALLQKSPSLPEYLRRFNKPERTLLLVDDEANVLAALKRLLRRDGYRILQANSGQEGLELLMQNDVGVIVSDQRMPGMTGVEFLREARKLCPETVRIVLSGYTEIQSITDAINEGAIYKFFTKPWEDGIIRGHIESAFKYKEMVDENQRLHLEIQQANYKMAAVNRRLEDALQQQQQQIAGNETSLNVMRSILRWLPLAVIGLDDQDMVVFVNATAQDLFGQDRALLGESAASLMSSVIEAVNGADHKHTCNPELNGNRYKVLVHGIGADPEFRGRILILTPLAEECL